MSQSPFPFFMSIRSRGLVLLALVFAVILGVAVYRADERRNTDRAHAIHELQLRAQLITEKQSEVIRHTRQYMETLVKSGEANRLANDPKCAEVLDRYIKQDPRFVNILITDSGGNYICGPLQESAGINIADRNYFQKAISVTETVIGEVITGRVSKRQAIPFAHSFRDKSGKVAGVLVISLDLSWVNNEFARATLPTDARLGLGDRAGNILARHPDPEKLAGTNRMDLPAMRAMIAQGGIGTAELPTFDGITRIYAFSHFAETLGGPIYLWIGVPKDSVTASADRQFTEAIIITVILAILTSVVTWLGAERLIIRPIGTISRAAQRLRDGDHQAHTGLAHTHDEIGQLAQTFDEMAVALMSKNDILRLNRALKVLSDGVRAIVHARDEKQMLDDICRTIVETGSYRMAWIGFAENDAENSVRPVASYGDRGYLSNVNITWDDTERGHGPTGTAIRTGKSQFNSSFENNPALKPWRAAASKHGYRSSSALPLLAEGKAFGALTIYSGESDPFSAAEVDLLEQLAADLSFGIFAQRLRHKHDESQVRIERSMIATVEAIATALEKRDPYTAGHERRVGQLAVAIARELGMSDHEIQGVELAAAVHDIGKIQVPAEILTKPTRLTSLEYKMIQIHAQAGYDILQGIDFPWPIAELVLQHHERLDGTGYPRNLKEADILPGAKILAIADVMESMATDRPYRPAMGISAALDELRKNKGKFYDPLATDACIRLFEEKGFVLN